MVNGSGGELVVTLTGGTNPNRHTVADAIRIARVATPGGYSMRAADADPFYDPLDNLATDWSAADEERLIWGEWLLVEAWRFNCRQLNLTTGSS